MARRHSAKVLEFVAEHVEGRTAKELAELTNDQLGTDFDKYSMKDYKYRHGLKSGRKVGPKRHSASRKFPQPVVDYIFQHFKGIGPKEMSERLNEQFGTEYTAIQLRTYYRNHNIKSGVDGRFKKGQIPKNAWKKGECPEGSKKNWYKKGNVPPNTAPVGAIRETSNGYLKIKLGPHKGDWKMLHIYEWEKANGKIPDGYCLTFRDGNRKNCVLDNLALISKGENGYLNKTGLRFEDPVANEVAVNVAKLAIAATRLEREVLSHGSSGNQKRQGDPTAPEGA